MPPGRASANSDTGCMDVLPAAQDDDNDGEELYSNLHRNQASDVFSF